MDRADADYHAKYRVGTTDALVWCSRRVQPVCATTRRDFR